MDRLQAMTIFVKVAEAEGFAEAGRQLNISPPAVTRAVAYLEELTRARLLIRTTRVVKLTEAGARYLEDCRRILSEISEAEASAGGSHSSPNGSLSLTTPVLFGQLHVMPIVTAFLDAYEGMTVRALLIDRVVNMIDEGIDVAIRIGRLQDSGLTAIRVGSVRRIICGSPAYFRSFGVPQTPQDLLRHKIIATRLAGTTVNWRFREKGKTSVALTPRLFCNTNEAALAAARNGWGISQFLSYQVTQGVDEGTLQIVLPEFEEMPLPIHIVHPEGRQTSAKARAFIDFAVSRLRENKAIN